VSAQISLDDRSSVDSSTIITVREWRTGDLAWRGSPATDRYRRV